MRPTEAFATYEEALLGKRSESQVPLCLHVLFSFAGGSWNSRFCATSTPLALNPKP